MAVLDYVDFQSTKSTTDRRVTICYQQQNRISIIENRHHGTAPLQMKHYKQISAEVGIF